MIKGAHVTFYTPKAKALRAFFRDKLGFASFDAGGGWLMFHLPPTELGVHPTEEEDSRESDQPSPVHAELSFYCDDLTATVAELKKKGIKFVGGVTDEGWGLVTQFRLPGGGEMQLYQPRYDKNP